MPLRLDIRPFSEKHFKTRLADMVKPTFDLLWGMPKDEKAIIFVQSSGQAQRTAIDMLLQAAIANAEQEEDTREEEEDTRKLLRRRCEGAFHRMKWLCAKLAQRLLDNRWAKRFLEELIPGWDGGGG